MTDETAARADAAAIAKLRELMSAEMAKPGDEGVEARVAFKFLSAMIEATNMEHRGGVAPGEITFAVAHACGMVLGNCIANSVKPGLPAAMGSLDAVFKVVMQRTSGILFFRMAGAPCVNLQETEGREGAERVGDAPTLDAVINALRNATPKGTA